MWTSCSFALMTAGRNGQTPIMFCDSATRQIKTWDVSIAAALAPEKIIGLTPGPEAKQIFESQFMTAACFSAILNKTNDCLARLKQATTAVSTGDNEVRLLELSRSLDAPHLWRTECCHVFERIIYS